MPECHRGGVDPTRSSKRNERTDDLTRSSEKNETRCLTRSSTKNKIICNGEETTGLLISGNLYQDSNQGVWSELSEEVAKELSRSIVSLALMDGDTVLFACSGIAVECDKRATRFLTSASLVKALHVKRKDHNNLKVCDGEPLFDGRFASMNLFLSTERTFFLQTFRSLLWLGYCTPLYKFKLPPRLNSNREAYRDVHNKDQIGDLESLGYPALPESVSNDDMILVNNFEDSFGDEYGKGVWNELSETASSNIRENIVALASFNGDKRLFACTGFFIKWNGCTAILMMQRFLKT